MSVAITFEIEVECDQCGSDLDVRFDGSVLSVKPCENCLRKESIEGYSEGKEEGYGEGYARGYDSGFDDGVNSIKENKE